MNVQELLDELRNNMLRDKSDLVSGPDDALWSDDALILYVNDAYRRFCRRSLLLRDNTTAKFTEVTLKSGISEYQLNSAVLAVISARFDIDENDLPRTSHDEMYTLPNTDSLMWDINSLSPTPPGRPRVWYTDDAVQIAANTKMKFRVYPTPSATEDGKIIHLRVARLPTDKLTLDKAEAELEIPEDYHIDMLGWAAYRALINQDLDGEAIDRAGKYKTQFEAVLAEVEQESRRKMFATTRFSFGRNGYSWARNAV